VGDADQCAVGWSAIAAQLNGAGVICIECYPGVDMERLEAELLREMGSRRVFEASTAYKSPDCIRPMLHQFLGDDPVFGRMNGLTIEDWLDETKIASMRNEIASLASARALVIGTGASLLVPDADLLIYADMARWEIQMRFRRSEAGNLGCNNREASFAEKYKCGYFAEWRAADRLKKQLLPRADFVLDTNDNDTPKMISGESFRTALESAVHRPFRVVPYFDPGPWGGHWMEEICDLPKDAPNHAWCFDCVPEENSIVLGFGAHRVEIPAIDLVFLHPKELLGEAVHARFGTEFPIRFDFLDTMGGGNLSLQVHPLTEYIQDKFGMHYTQDESYYLLDAKPGACVYLRLAQAGGYMFPAEQYVNQFPAKKHDHFLIPAGTIHCSGKDSMVLEISATPYIFTFKLWDW